MKKLLLLIITIPLFAFSQEMPIAWKVNNVWIVSPQVEIEAQAAFDSVQSSYQVDTSFVKFDSVVQIGFTDGVSLFTDCLIGYNDHDTIYTTALYACSVTCKNYNECLTGYCYKGTDCKCYCSGDGGCSSIYLAIFGEAPIGGVIRNRILISNGHEIPSK